MENRESCFSIYMRAILTAIIFITSLVTSAQNKKPASKKQEAEYLAFTKVENEANTDWAQWNRYIMKNVQLPDSLVEEMGAANLTVIVTFIVDKYGRVTDVKAEKDPGYGLGARVVKLVKNYPGTWKPAVQCGNLVSSYKRIPITFCLDRER